MGVYHKSSPLSDRNYEVYAVRFVSSVTTRIKEIIGENEFNDLMLHTALSVPDEIKPKIIDIYEQMLIEYDNYDSVAEFSPAKSARTAHTYNVPIRYRSRNVRNPHFDGRH